MDEKLDFDATKLFEALKYQMLVAMEHCHSLGKSESLWIEVFGDITRSGMQQFEIKYYADKLTDGHHNLWNTLNNWLKPEFDHHRYVSLVLLTTQSYGENSRIKTWDNLTPTQKVDALDCIHDEMEAQLVASGRTTVSKAIQLQRKVLAKEHRAELIGVLGKMRIITEQSRLPERLTAYKTQHLRMIMDHRCDDYMNDMFGFLTSPALMLNGWQITSEAFTAKTRELTARYMVGTMKFPRVDHQVLERKASEMDVKDRRYAVKLAEIDAHHGILDATVDLLHAEHYALQLIDDCAISQKDIEGYTRNQYKTHIDNWRSTLLQCTSTMSTVDLKRKSQQFYYQRRGLPVDRLGNFDVIPVDFRNGIYQLLADEEPGTRQQEFHWKMWE